MDELKPTDPNRLSEPSDPDAQDPELPKTPSCQILCSKLGAPHGQ